MNTETDLQIIGKIDSREINVRKFAAHLIKHVVGTGTASDYLALVDAALAVRTEKSSNRLNNTQN